MKKIVLFIALSISVNTSFAQLSLGLKISRNASKFIFKTPDNQQISGSSQGFKSVYGLSGGIMANYKLTHRFSLQSEILFDALNTSYYKTEYYTNYSGDYRAATNDFSVEMQYLEMPLLGKVSFGNKATFDIFAGGFIGYKLSAKKSTQDGQLDLPIDSPYDPMMDPQQIRIPYPPDQDVHSDYSNFNAGLLIGCGVTMRERVILEIRVNRGLVNINKADASKISTLQGNFTVGYYLFRQKNKVFEE